MTTTISLTHDQVANLMMALSEDQRQTSGLYFVQTADGQGNLTVPDSLSTTVNAALSSTSIAQQQIAALKAAAASIRYGHETGGITVAGAAIATDRQSQSMIANAIALLQANTSLASINYKANNGWQTVARDDMIKIGVTVGNFVQLCFSCECSIDASIDAGTTTTVDQITSAQWPSNSF